MANESLESAYQEELSHRLSNEPGDRQEIMRKCYREFFMPEVHDGEQRDALRLIQSGLESGQLSEEIAERMMAAIYEQPEPVSDQFPIYQ